MDLIQRIKANWRPGIGYHELMRAVFPLDEYPRAWRYSSNGGPPGCAMAFGSGLRRAGFFTLDIGGERTVYRGDSLDDWNPPAARAAEQE